ncbi:DUF418 domain-containing protein [Granulicella sp. WH15]|nr:DUF418 domain-containing protein [Granulicella sp. WH15]
MPFGLLRSLLHRLTRWRLLTISRQVSSFSSFPLGPWKLYGQFEYYQLYYVVFAVWIFNLVSCSIWLRYFNFGPMEWLWRSLTYWKIQPILSHNA